MLINRDQFLWQTNTHRPRIILKLDCAFRCRQVALNQTWAASIESQSIMLVNGPVDQGFYISTQARRGLPVSEETDCMAAFRLLRHLLAHNSTGAKERALSPL